MERDGDTIPTLRVAGPFKTAPLHDILEREKQGRGKNISVVGALAFVFSLTWNRWLHPSPVKVREPLKHIKSGKNPTTFK